MAGNNASQNKSTAYDMRFKHKLNMLEPGTRMLKWTGILLLTEALLLLLGLKTAAYCLLGLSGALFAVLVILLAVESYQDRVLNEIAAEDAKEAERLVEQNRF